MKKAATVSKRHRYWFIGVATLIALIVVYTAYGLISPSADSSADTLRGVLNTNTGTDATDWPYTVQAQQTNKIWKVQPKPTATNATAKLEKAIGFSVVLTGDAVKLAPTDAQKSGFKAGQVHYPTVTEVSGETTATTYEGQLVANSHAVVKYYVEVPQPNGKKRKLPAAPKTEAIATTLTALVAQPNQIHIDGQWETDQDTLGKPRVFMITAAYTTDTVNPSPTPVPATPTPSPAATVTPAPTPTATVTASPVISACSVNLDVTFVVDNSGTMNDTPAGSLLKQFVSSSKTRWQSTDQLSLVQFSNPTNVVNRFTSDFNRVTSSVANMDFDGDGSNAGAGVAEASKLFKSSRRDKATIPGVVIVLTDGGGQLGTSAYNIAQQDFQTNNVRYFGVALNKNNSKLKTLTEKGGGAYYFLNSTANVSKTVNDIFTRLGQTSGSCITVDLASDISNLRTGQTTNLVYTYRNTSRQTIENVIVTQPLPVGIVTADGSATSFTVTIGRVAPGGTGTVKKLVKAVTR